jgi:hypothetical protein
MAKVKIEIEVEVDGPVNALKPEDFTFVNLTVPGGQSIPLPLEQTLAPRRLSRDLALVAGKALLGIKDSSAKG